MKRKMQSKPAYAIALLLVLLTLSLAGLFQMKKPLSPAAERAFARIAKSSVQNREYFEVSPQGQVLAGVIIYPDVRENPSSYAPLAERLAKEGYRTRVVKYPLGQPALSRADKKQFLHDGGGIPWVALGFGEGLDLACTLADRSEEVRGLILMGACSNETNLTDNDIRVTLYQLAQDPIATAVLEAMKKRLPADLALVTAPSQAQILEEIPVREGEAWNRILGNESAPEQSLITEIQRILAKQVQN